MNDWKRKNTGLLLIVIGMMMITETKAQTTLGFSFPPDLELESNINFDYYGGSLQITPQILNIHGSASYIWIPDNCLSSSNVSNPLVSCYSETPYVFTVVDSWGCEKSAIVTISDKTDVKNLSNAYKLTVFPNPANNVLNLSFSSEPSDYAKINIVNTLGKIVFSQNIYIKEKTTVIDISSVPDGLYLLVVSAKNETFRQKLIVQ